MDDKSGYAVFFFPQALESLGDAIKPYLQEGPAGAHVVCREIDTAGSLIEMTLDGQTTRGQAIQLELMVPTNMVRMIVSARSGEDAFGFGPRIEVPVVVPAAAPTPELPPVGPQATPAEAPSQALPAAAEAPEAAPTQTPPKP